MKLYILFLVFFLPTDNNQSPVIKNCRLKDINLFGKVQFVEHSADFTVQFVENFPDINVMFVGQFPDKCGKWQIVNSFPDFKVKVVESFPDVKVKVVSAFPGMP
jgi:hypothetical protein